MEDNLKISKVGYLRDHLLDPTQMLNFDDKTLIYNSFKWRRPHMGNWLQDVHPMENL